MKLWKSQHEGKVPKSFAEKQEFKEKCIKGLALDFGKETNFNEALKNAYLLFQDVDLDQNIQEIFDSDNIADLKEKSEFWLLSAAMKKFYEAENRLPVNA